MTDPTPIPAAAVEAEQLAIAALASAMWDAEHTSRLSSSPLDQEQRLRMVRLAEEVTHWLKAHGYEVLPHLASPAVESALFQREIEQLHERLAAAEAERDAMAERLREYADEVAHWTLSHDVSVQHIAELERQIATLTRQASAEPETGEAS